MKRVNTGLDVQVLSLTTPALHHLGPESVDLARRTNDALAAAVARHPTRFQAMATLPMAVPEAAARELERCVKTLGFKGTLLCSLARQTQILQRGVGCCQCRLSGRPRKPFALQP